MKQFLQALWKILTMALGPASGLEDLHAEIKKAVEKKAAQRLDAAEELAQKEAKTKDLQKEIGKLLK